MLNPLKYFINRKVGLALGSGGAKGIAHIAVIEYLKSMNIPVHYVAGASIGALIGALYCSGSLNAFKNDLLSMDRKSYSDFFDPIFPISGLLNADTFMEFIKKYIPGGMLIEDLKIPIGIVATDYKTGQPVLFRSGKIIDAIRASISIPGIFTPVPYRDTFLIDGGVANPLPVDIVKSMGAGITLAVNLHPSLPLRKEKGSPIIPVKEKIEDDEIEDKNPYLGFIIEKARNIALLGKNTWLKYMNNFMNNEKIIDKKKLPNIFEILFQSIDIMGYNATTLMLKYDPPSVLIEPDLLYLKSLDFNRGPEALAEGKNACDRVKDQLIQKVKLWL